MPGTTTAQPSCLPDHCQDFPWQFGHNPAAWVGIVLCIILLLVWRDRNSIYLNRRKEDWRDGD